MEKDPSEAETASLSRAAPMSSPCAPDVAVVLGWSPGLLALLLLFAVLPGVGRP